MRLIDADALIHQVESDANQMEDPIAIMFTYAAISDIKHAPTVKSIPIEWIEQYGRENWYDFGTQHNAIAEMLKAWREKNESD